MSENDFPVIIGYGWGWKLHKDRNSYKALKETGVELLSLLKSGR